MLNGVTLTPRTLMFQMEYAKVGYCHQNYLLYMFNVDDLSHELTLCKSGCYIDDQFKDKLKLFLLNNELVLSYPK